jgi:hypothetical protein
VGKTTSRAEDGIVLTAILELIAKPLYHCPCGSIINDIGEAEHNVPLRLARKDVDQLQQLRREVLRFFNLQDASSTNEAPRMGRESSPLAKHHIS